jgi:hypothetical protein
MTVERGFGDFAQDGKEKRLKVASIRGQLRRHECGVVSIVDQDMHVQVERRSLEIDPMQVGRRTDLIDLAPQTKNQFTGAIGTHTSVMILVFLNVLTVSIVAFHQQIQT